MTDLRPSDLNPHLAAIPASGIGEVANYGRGRPGMIPLWIGEGDRPTPAFICEAASRALAEGRTFYTWQRGIPELRAAIAAYTDRLYGGTHDVSRFTVTIGGMHALQIAIRLTTSPGDEAILPTPAWTNFRGAAAVAGATVVPLPLTPGPDGWGLDLERLEATITPRTRVLMVNSPANPTGWTASRDELAAILAVARRHGLWIIADEIYTRFVFEPGRTVPGAAVAGARSASFRDVMSADDRVLFIQTFSKNWSMTGWRIGWLEAPAALGPKIESLVQYSTSGVPMFLQWAAITALEQGEELVASNVETARRGRALVCEGLGRTGLVDLPAPPGAFYAFFRVRGLADSRSLALKLVDVANVGVAPGTAFGPDGQGFLRVCFLRDETELAEAVRRLAAALPAAMAEAA
jgi:aspartate/methionine/tyrosine aminotransferase